MSEDPGGLEASDAEVQAYIDAQREAIRRAFEDDEETKDDEPDPAAP